MTFKWADSVLWLILFMFGFLLLLLVLVFWSGWFLHVYVYVVYKHCAHVCTYVITYRNTYGGRGWIWVSCLVTPCLRIEVVSHLIPELTDLTGLFSVLICIPCVCSFSSGITCEPTMMVRQPSFRWVVGIWTPVLTHTWQALYPLAHLSRPCLKHVNSEDNGTPRWERVIWLWCQNQRFSYHHHGDEIWNDKHGQDCSSEEGYGPERWLGSQEDLLVEVLGPVPSTHTVAHDLWYYNSSSRRSYVLYWPQWALCICGHMHPRRERSHRHKIVTS